MDYVTEVKLAVYGYFAETGGRPSPGEIAERLDSDEESVLGAYHQLRDNRMLVLEADGESIRMAPPFSGVPTQHAVESGGCRYFQVCSLKVPMVGLR